MQTNESIIAVPISVERKGQTRQFLVRLVEQLDIVLGTRGGDPYVAASQLTQTTKELTKLESVVLAIVESLLDTTLTDEILTEVLEAVEALKSSSVISNSTTTLTPITDPPTKIEVEAIDAKLVANAADFNSLLAALRDTGIIAT